MLTRVRCQVAADMAENDLVLLCRENPLTSATTPAVHALASVEGTEGKQALRLRLHLGAQAAR